MNTDAATLYPGLSGSNCFLCMQTLPSAFMNNQYSYYYIKYKTLDNSIFKEEKKKKMDICSLFVLVDTHA